MLIEEINIPEVIENAYSKISELGDKLVARRRRNKDVVPVSVLINHLMEGVGYLESNDVSNSDKLKIAQRLIEIGDIRDNSTGVYKGDTSKNSETIS